MSDDELPGRVRRAVAGHDAFTVEDGRARAVSTPFEGTVEATEREDGHVAFAVTVRLPMLGEVTEGEVAEVVEDGWYDTFELRAEDPGAVTEAGHDLAPTVSRADREAVVEAEFADIDERRGVNDAAAVVDFVEGTFVQGVIPGYDYTDPVASILTKARRAGGSDGVGRDDDAVGR
ncbi:MAG: DUF5813 family protein [Halolamina sp.]